MGFKYQLILLGTLNDLSERLIVLFYTKVSELKLQKEAFSIITETTFKTDYTGNQPAFVIYFGDVDGKFKNLDIIQRLMKDGTMILPVFFEEFCFEKQIPEIIRGQNGLLYDKSKDDKIVNLALESFELLRSLRKVFVSYRRDESSSVAIQLYEALERK